MSITGLVLLIIAGTIGVSWWRLLKGKVLALSDSAFSCREHVLVLMDDTVFLDSIQFKREDHDNAWGL